MPLLRSLQPGYDRALADEFAAQPLTDPTPLSEADLAHLPDPVRRFIKRSGAVGRPRPQNIRVELDAQMWRKPGQAPMAARSLQYNFFGRPARLFLMKARMFGLPVTARHLYRDEAAAFVVRVASLVTITDHSGPVLTAGETVTVLNDMCFFAPGALVDERISWHPVDDRTATATLANGPHRVSATLLFNDRDELVDFWSDDRPADDNGTLRPLRWSTPIEGYREIDGRLLPTKGSAVYAYPEGDFTYGAFTLRSIAYDVACP
jgi:hypothetical protein